MSARRIARECAVQFLYQHLPAKGQDLEEALALFWPLREITEPVRLFGEELIRGTLKNLPAIDEKVKAYAENWDMERIAAVDLAVIRLGVYEMLFRDDIPPVVSINEAIEIAKRFSSEDSGRFVNGILDRVRKDLLRPARQAAGGGGPAA